MKPKTPIIAIFLVLLLWPFTIQGQEQTGIRFKALDSEGRAVPVRTIKVAVEEKPVGCLEDVGFLFCPGDFPNDASVLVDAEGFDSFETTVLELRNRSGIITLKRPSEFFTVEVYASSERGRLSPMGMSQVIVSSSELKATAAPVLDDALRQIAGFSTFRRTSGRQANPTTQGVSLRGVGSSGASRTAVLEDGVQLNDPFGGWVQWNRVVQPLVSEVEVSRGGASGFYGNAAVSGAVVIKPLERRDGRFSGEVFGGSQRSIGANGRIAESFGGWFVAGGFSSLRTRGYIPVDESVRGTVDSFAGVRYDSFQVRALGNLTDEIQITLKPSVFGEVRTNGTGIQTNRTHSRSMLAGISYLRNNFQLRGRAHGLNQVYDQMFSTVAANRNSEALNRVQRVPSRSFGVSADSSYTTAGNFLNTVALGADFRQVRGASDEIGFASGSPTIRTGAGGTQRITSVFVTNRFAKEKIVLNFSVRGDFWGNKDGRSVSTPISTGITTTNLLGDRNYSRFSGRGGVSFQASTRISLFASVSSSFRAPTLNELYRGFRVGNILTQPNENLLPEKAWELDSGAVYSTRRFRIRGSLFRNNISDTVSNVTINSTPSLITRQRRNVGRTVSQGFEVEAEGRLSESLTFSAGYLFADSTVREFASNPILIGLRIPQVARHQATLQSRWERGRLVVTKQFRFSGPQFDDDLNLFRLEGFAQADVYISFLIRDRVRLFSGVENLFNVRYSTAKTPIRSVGPPLGARFGIRWN